MPWVHPSPSRPLLLPHMSPCSSAGPPPGCSPSGTTCSRLGSPRPQLLQEIRPCCGVGPSPGCRLGLCSSGVSPGLQGIPAPGLQHLLPSSSSGLGVPLLLLPPWLPPPLPVLPLALAETCFPPAPPAWLRGSAVSCAGAVGAGWDRLEPAVCGTGQPRPLPTQAALQPLTAPGH